MEICTPNDLGSLDCALCECCGNKSVDQGSTLYGHLSYRASPLLPCLMWFIDHMRFFFFLMNVISNCAYVNMPKYINIVVGCTHAEGRLWWLHYISLKSELVDLKNLN